MQITKESDTKAKEAVQKSARPPKLTLIANQNEDSAEKKQAVEKDWDPYVVWKNLIRRSPDPT